MRTILNIQKRIIEFFLIKYNKIRKETGDFVEIGSLDDTTSVEN